MSRIFIKKVPSELVLEFYKCINYETLNDQRAFDQSFFSPKTIENIQELYPKLKPYLRLNKQYLLTRDQTPKNQISLLRLLGNSEDRKLLYKAQGADKIYRYILEAKGNNENHVGGVQKTLS